MELLLETSFHVLKHDGAFSKTRHVLPMQDSMTCNIYARECQTTIVLRDNMNLATAR